MKLYTTIEEHFCTKRHQNVPVQIHHYSNGTKQRNCLHQAQCEYQNCQTNDLPKSQK